MDSSYSIKKIAVDKHDSIRKIHNRSSQNESIQRMTWILFQPYPSLLDEETTTEIRPAAVFH
jgi:hypothetical protein